MTHPPAPAFAAPLRALRGGPRSPQSRDAPTGSRPPSAPLSQPRAVPPLPQTLDRDAVPERAAMPREMTGFYRAGVQVGGCFVGIAAGRPSSGGSGYTDLVALHSPGSPKRKQFRPGKVARRRLAWLQCLAARPGARKGRDLRRAERQSSTARRALRWSRPVFLLTLTVVAGGCATMGCALSEHTHAPLGAPLASGVPRNSPCGRRVWTRKSPGSCGAPLLHWVCFK